MILPMELIYYITDLSYNKNIRICNKSLYNYYNNTKHINCPIDFIYYSEFPECFKYLHIHASGRKDSEHKIHVVIRKFKANTYLLHNVYELDLSGTQIFEASLFKNISF